MDEIVNSPLKYARCHSIALCFLHKTPNQCSIERNPEVPVQKIHHMYLPIFVERVLDSQDNTHKVPDLCERTHLRHHEGALTYLTGDPHWMACRHRSWCRVRLLECIGINPCPSGTKCAYDAFKFQYQSVGVHEGTQHNPCIFG